MRVAGLKQSRNRTPKSENLERWENITKQVENAERDLNAFVEMLWKDYVAYASVKHPRPVTLKESALKPNEHVVIFDVSEEGVGVKLIRGKEIVETYYNKWKLSDLEQEVKKFRRCFEEVSLRDFNPELGKALYKKLLGRVLMDVPEGTPITIIPDGVLALLPFEALVIEGKAKWREVDEITVPEGLTYVGDAYPISYYQSITAMTLARTQGNQNKPKDKVLVMADPVFGLDDSRLTNVPDEKETENDGADKASAHVD